MKLRNAHFIDFLSVLYFHEGTRRMELTRSVRAVTIVLAEAVAALLLLLRVVDDALVMRVTCCAET